MNLVKLSFRNLMARPLSTLLSLILLTMGVCIISLLLLLDVQLKDKLYKNIDGIDMVVGAKGSPLQLILANVYHIDHPTGNIPLKEVSKITRSMYVDEIIPLAYGDNFAGYRIVGTSKKYPDHYKATLAEGKFWEAAFEATVGANVAEAEGLKLGDTFYSAHGEAEDGEVHEHHAFKVVGILKPSNTVLDQLILTNMESIWLVHDHGGSEEMEEEEHAHEEHHDHGHHDHEAELPPADKREITAVLVKFSSPMGNVMMPRMINQSTSMQAAAPAIELDRLLQLLGFGIDTLQAIALAIILLAGVSVFISLFNSMKERKYELAVMRSLGASRLKLFFMLIQESVLLVIIGSLLGFAASRVGMAVLSGVMEKQFHYGFDNLQILRSEVDLFAMMIGIGIVAAIIPGIQAYSTKISKTLSEG